MFILKGKRGFTLTELCVALAVAAIIGAMVVTTITLYSEQTMKIKLQGSFIEEVSDVQKVVDAWVKRNDSAQTMISASADGDKLKAGTKAEKTLTFSGGTIKEDGKDISKKYNDIADISFSVSEGNEKLIKITVKAKKDMEKEEKQVLLIPFFSSKTMQRSVTGRK